MASTRSHDIMYTWVAYNIPQNDIQIDIRNKFPIVARLRTDPHPWNNVLALPLPLSLITLLFLDVECPFFMFNTLVTRTLRKLSTIENKFIRKSKPQLRPESNPCILARHMEHKWDRTTHASPQFVLNPRPQDAITAWILDPNSEGTHMSPWHKIMYAQFVCNM